MLTYKDVIKKHERDSYIARRRRHHQYAPVSFPDLARADRIFALF